MENPNPDPGRTGQNQPDVQNSPAPWGEILLALVPFLILPVFIIIFLIFSRIRPNSPENEAIGTVYLLLVYGIELVLLAISVAKGFPRWSLPHWPFMMLVTIFLPGPLMGNGVKAGWLIWLLFLSLVIVAILAPGPRRSLLRLVADSGRDWTLLSFAFYGILPLWTLFAYDEVHNTEPFIATWMLILAAGALLYMRSKTVLQRGLSLLAGFLLNWSLAALHLALYWDGRGEPWPSGVEVAWGAVVAGVILLVLLFIPLLFRILSSAIRSTLSGCSA
jgi:hypothetical protein